MKEKILNLLDSAIEGLKKDDFIPASVAVPNYYVEIPAEAKYGDYATNLAMVLAKSAKKPPREIAQKIIEKLQVPNEFVDEVEIAGAGFINFFVSPVGWHNTLIKILSSGDKYGSLSKGQGKKVMVEYVSVNPTGPLHVGHGRGAIVGDVVASILKKAGYNVSREYYINDAGAQVDNLAKSLYARYREVQGLSCEIPEDGYYGDYVREWAEGIYKEIGGKYADKMTEEAFVFFRDEGLKRALADIKQGLVEFGVVFDDWFSEASLHESGAVKKAIEVLVERGYIYESDKALWFKSSTEGDEKDRVVYKSDGTHTYLTSDIAYHKNKLDRGYEWLINVWGADHHGYIARVNAAIKALTGKDGVLSIILVQIVHVLRNGEPVKLSKRAGEIETLRDLVKEVGRDAARLFFIMRAADAPLDFDLELAKKESQDNPVYYIQYGYARIASVLRKAAEAGVAIPEVSKENALGLSLAEEFAIVKKLSEYPEIIDIAATKLAPQIIVSFLRETIALFHSYYTRYKDSEKIISDSAEKTRARLLLVLALKNVLKDGFSLLGVSAPEKM